MRILMEDLTLVCIPSHLGNSIKTISLMTLTITLLLVLLITDLSSQSSQSDNQPVGRHCDTEDCDSIINKCTLTDKCSCDFKNDAQCAKLCIDCLEEKFGKCCACVGLCPSTDNELYSSHVGDINNHDQAFFEVLTETDDIHGRWSVFPHDGVRLSHPQHGQVELAYRFTGQNHTISDDTNLRKANCTVAFINRYLSMTKCKKSCTSLGASFFRWFHEGCCECIGKYCLNYGINKPHCNIDKE